MTSMSQISAASRMSPNARMQQALQTAVTSGTVSSTDQTALSGALDSIDASMKSSKPTAGSDPASKISDLIDQQVSDGKLTDDQATELKQLFTDNAPKRPGESSQSDGSDELASVDGTSGTRQMRGPRGAGGPPPGPPPGGDADSDSDSDSDTTTSSSDSSNAMIEKMIAFLKKLEEANSSTTNYGSSGTSAAGSYSSMLVDSAA